MTCEQLHEVYARAPDGATVAEMAALIAHTDRCEACSQFLDMEYKKIEAQVKSPEQMAHLVARGLRLQNRLDSDPEAREVMNGRHETH